MTILTCTRPIVEHGPVESFMIPRSRVDNSAARANYYLSTFRGVRWNIAERTAVPLDALREIFRMLTDDAVSVVEWGIWLQHAAGVSLTRVTAFTPDALNPWLVLPFNSYVIDRLTGLAMFFEYIQQPCVTPCDGCFLVAVADLT